MGSHGGSLNLGHILAADGVTGLDDVLVIRHTYRTLERIGTFADATPENLLEFTRCQDLRASKIPQAPGGTWLVFLADGGRRSRFLCAYENRGEAHLERTADFRFFELRQSEILSSFRKRLVIDWPKDVINWAKRGDSAASFPVVEISDPNMVPFPGFDRLRVSYDELLHLVEEPRYSEWRAALSSVQGIYLIADTTNGKLYVGKADGLQGILGRWTAYAQNGHGDNRALRELVELDPSHARHFNFSILRVFGPQAITSEVDEAETHYKQALLTRQPFGLNWN